MHKKRARGLTRALAHGLGLTGFFVGCGFQFANPNPSHHIPKLNTKCFSALYLLFSITITNHVNRDGVPKVHKLKLGFVLILNLVRLLRMCN